MIVDWVNHGGREEHGGMAHEDSNTETNTKVNTIKRPGQNYRVCHADTSPWLSAGCGGIPDCESIMTEAIEQRATCKTRQIIKMQHKETVITTSGYNKRVVIYRMYIKAPWCALKDLHNTIDLAE